MMLALLIPLTLASPTVSAAGVSLGAFAAPTETADRNVALRIDYQRLIEQESEASVQDTVSYIRQDTTAALREKHGVEVVDDARSPAIVVVLSWVRHDDSVYGVTIQTRRPGEEARKLETFECECIDSGLTQAVLERLPAALAKLEEEAVAEPGPGAGPGSGPAGVGEEPVETDPSGEEAIDRPRRPLGAMGKAGIGLLAGGVAGVVAGGIVFAQGRKPDQAPGSSWDATGRNFEPPGIALMVSGGVALATGVALIVVDRRKAHRNASARIMPAPGGLVLTGRF
jgi:hypothetical protein